MGHRSKFTFPVPGRKSKQHVPPSDISPPPLTKAQRILGSVGINIDSRTNSPGQQWDSKSSISFSISESSIGHSHTTQRRVTADDELSVTDSNHGRRGWDVESEIIPQKLLREKGLTSRRSAATIGNDYKTDASSLTRRQSNASTILSHYDRSKVPLSISQQTSNSAMAKGLPSKALSLLDLDGLLAGPAAKKRKPARLDLSLLKSRGQRSQQQSQAAESTSSSNYLTRISSNSSQLSSKPLNSGTVTPEIYSQSPLLSSKAAYDGLKGRGDAATLGQLYDHYEQMSFRSTLVTEEDGESWQHRPTDTIAEEPTPPLTTSSTLSQANTPLPSSTFRNSARSPGHSGRSSTHGRDVMIGVISPNSLPYSNLPRKEYASSISSRNTRTSKGSRAMDSDLLQHSVLSLSDSESDDGTYTDSVPKSSMKSSVSSHTNASQDDDMANQAGTWKHTPIRPPVIQERISSKPKQGTFVPINDYLVIPSTSNKQRSGRATSHSTLRSNSSSASTATTTGPASAIAQGDGTKSTSTEKSHGRTATKQNRESVSVPHEATAIRIAPLASTAEALDYLTDMVNGATSPSYHSRSSEPITPPISPSDAEYPEADVSKHEGGSEDLSSQARNARLMAVTKQEEMLLAALRQKRARMREDIMASLEHSKSRTSSHSRGTSSSIPEIVDLRSTTNSRRPVAKPVLVDHKSSSTAPRLPSISLQATPLSSSLKELTMGEKGTTRTQTPDDNVRIAGGPSITSRLDPLEIRCSAAFSTHTVTGDSQNRQQRMLMYLDRAPDDDVDAADSISELYDDFAEEPVTDDTTSGKPSGENERGRPGRSRHSILSSKYSPFPHARSSPLTALTSSSRQGEKQNPERLSVDWTSRQHYHHHSTSSLKQNRFLGKQPTSDLKTSAIDDDVDEDLDMDIADFDGFSDVMYPASSYGHVEGTERASSTSSSIRKARSAEDAKTSAILDEVVRPDSPVNGCSTGTRGKNRGVRLSAVGYAGGQFAFPEVDAWGDDG